MSRLLTNSEIEQELLRCRDIQEDVSGDESSDDIIDSVCENRDAEYQSEQVTSSSEDSEVDSSATNNNIIVNSRRGRGVSRRSISGGRTARGGGSARTSSDMDLFFG
ncbi:hypothetical protein ABMA28_004146 [Loxostege sticticalis]|uniref:Uncharacterized protein n=1 Tax=Loxostege sticticalis TaxID=481309 RepID=A0ABD0SUD6_LOXSC